MHHTLIDLVAVEDKKIYGNMELCKFLNPHLISTVFNSNIQAAAPAGSSRIYLPPPSHQDGSKCKQSLGSKASRKSGTKIISILMVAISWFWKRSRTIEELMLRGAVKLNCWEIFCLRYRYRIKKCKMWTMLVTMWESEFKVSE